MNSNENIDKIFKSVLTGVAVAALFVNLALGFQLIDAVRDIQLHAQPADIDMSGVENAILAIHGRDGLLFGAYIDFGDGEPPEDGYRTHVIRAMPRDVHADITAELQVMYWYQDQRREQSAAMDWINSITLEGRVTLPEDVWLVDAYRIILTIDGVSHPSELFINR